MLYITGRQRADPSRSPIEVMHHPKVQYSAGEAWRGLLVSCIKRPRELPRSMHQRHREWCLASGIDNVLGTSYEKNGILATLGACQRSERRWAIRPRTREIQTRSPNQRLDRGRVRRLRSECRTLPLGSWGPGARALCLARVGHRIILSSGAPVMKRMSTAPETRGALRTSSRSRPRIDGGSVPL